jgi:hypothetical protein
MCSRHPGWCDHPNRPICLRVDRRAVKHIGHPRLGKFRLAKPRLVGLDSFPPRSRHASLYQDSHSSPDDGPWCHNRISHNLEDYGLSRAASARQF